MFSRLIIIVLMLCVPLVVAVMAQQLTRTVPAPELSSEIVQVKLNRTGSRISPAAPTAQEVPLSYTPRTVKNFNPEGSAAYTTKQTAKDKK